jgi:hypothetical protein
MATWPMSGTCAVQVFSITVPESFDERRVDAYVKSLSTKAKRTYALGGSFRYDIPREDIALSEIFKRVAELQAQGLPILDWAVHSASLEDVFIDLARAEAEAAEAGAPGHT